jgi:hypothetical protein
VDDIWDDPNAKIWVRNVLDEMVPKLADSALVISMVPNGRSEGDVKYWVELGASIMYDKPIIALVLGDTEIPPKLVKVADKVVRLPEGINPEASDALAQAIREMMEDEE